MRFRPSQQAMQRIRRSPFTSPRRWQRRLVLWGGAILVSIIAVIFADLADRASNLFTSIALRVPALGIVLPPVGLIISVWLTRGYFQGAQGSGIPQVMASMHLADAKLVSRVLSLRIAAGKILLTLFGLCCGASIGREGPTVQVGAALMRWLGALSRTPSEQTQRALVLAGGAAGIAAAFNTPLAGVVFAIEELSHSFEARASGVVLTAVIIAGIATQSLVGNYTYFGSTGAQFDLGDAWIAVLLCAVGGGVLGGLFSASLLAIGPRLRGPTGRWIAQHPLAFAGACGLVIALLGVISHGATFGTGYQQARSLVEGHSDLSPAFFLYKLLATVASYLSGIPGGIFAPSLAVGAGLGHAISNLLPSSPSGAVVLLGMVGYFSGVVQAPITSAVIVLEMTENQRMTIPLMATAMLAFAVSRLVCHRPLYSALARRFLRANEPG